MPEQPSRGQERRVLAEVLPVHQQVLPVHVDLHVVDPLRAERVDHVQRHAHVPHEDLHRGLGVLVLEEEENPVLLAALCRLPDAVDEPCPALGIRRLERIVVALDPGPEDEVRADLAREVDRLERERESGVAHGVVRGRETALAEPRVEVQPGADGVDAVPVERGPDVVEVLCRELLRIVKLVVVHQRAEAFDGAMHLLGGGLARVLRLIAARHEARDHGAERPDSKARFHVTSLQSTMPR